MSHNIDVKSWEETSRVRALWRQQCTQGTMVSGKEKEEIALHLHGFLPL